jgi:hypothetical protein
MNADKAKKPQPKLFGFRFIRECEASDFIRVQFRFGVDLHQLRITPYDLRVLQTFDTAGLSALYSLSN